MTRATLTFRFTECTPPLDQAATVLDDANEQQTASKTYAVMRVAEGRIPLGEFNIGEPCDFAAKQRYIRKFTADYARLQPEAAGGAPCGCPRCATIRRLRDEHGILLELDACFERLDPPVAGLSVLYDGHGGDARVGVVVHAVLHIASKGVSVLEVPVGEPCVTDEVRARYLKGVLAAFRDSLLDAAASLSEGDASEARASAPN